MDYETESQNSVRVTYDQLASCIASLVEGGEEWLEILHIDDEFYEVSWK